MDSGGLNPTAVRNLFGQLMVVNPSVEVYLLDSTGRITGYDAPADRLQRKRVSLAPIQRLLAGGSLPIMGDDPRSRTEEHTSELPSPMRIPYAVFRVTTKNTQQQLSNTHT